MRPLRLAISIILSLPLAGAMSLAEEKELSQEELSAIYESSDVDEAIERSIQYLLTKQDTDGAFRVKPREFRHDAAMTSLAMLAFAAAGHQPVDATEEGRAQLKALEFMLTAERQEEDGYFGKRDGSRMYGHGIVTLMLAEMLGMGVDDEQDEQIRTKCQKAVELILRAQKIPKDKTHKGGWRYQPNAKDADISVTVWQVMALRAAQNAGIDVPKWAIDDAVGYLKACHRDPSHYNNDRRKGHPLGCAYQPKHTPKFSTAAAGMLAFQVCGGYELQQVRCAADWFKDDLPKPNEDFFYYGLYYYAQGMYQQGGDYEDVARGLLAREMMPQQDRDGSWRSKSGKENEVGRIYTTSLAVMTLAVNYHYLPIYQR